MSAQGTSDGSLCRLTIELHDVWVPDGCERSNLTQKRRRFALFADSHALDCQVAAPPAAQIGLPKHALAQQPTQDNLQEMLALVDWTLYGGLFLCVTLPKGLCPSLAVRKASLMLAIRSTKKHSHGA